jgi:putative ABC transport system permease protein
MRLNDYLAGALEDIAAAKLRSFLTALGIIIGVGSVVLMLSIGAGVERTVTGAFADLGSTRVTIAPSRPGAGPGGGPGGGGPGGGVASTLTVADAEAIAEVSGVAAAAPVIQVPARAEGPAGAVDLTITGTTPAYGEATGQELTTGRLFDLDADEVVLNQAAADQLVSDRDAAGQTITIRERQYTVVGVFANQQSPFAQVRSGGRDDEATARPIVFLPIERALDIAETRHVSQIVLIAASPEQVNNVVAEVESTMLDLHDGVDDFSVTSFQQLMESFTQIFDVLTAFLAAIAGISLLVGGIGIMNIMLASVTERTREIGIAKAIGATRRNIVLQFLTESMLLSVRGGLLGLGVAWIGTLLLQRALDLPAIVTPGAIMLAVGVSAAIGIFFGVFPAWRAARLDPIVALRHE